MKKGTTLKTNIEKIYGSAPKQYQKGWTEFYKLKFKVTKDVLIPRPETELLVDEVLKLKPSSVLDLGTGSGCIAISIAKNLPNTKVVALDIDKNALEIAKQNARFHKVEKNTVFLQNDLLTGFENIPDILVTNLPYIPSSKLMLIDPMVTEWEPKIALDGGVDGFEVYRRLFKQMNKAGLYPKYLIAEIDEGQRETALSEAKKYFPTAQADVKKDLTKRDRLLIIKF